MQKRLLKLSSVFMLLILSFSLFSFTTSAAQADRDIGERSIIRGYPSLSYVGNKNASSHPSLSLYINGRVTPYSAKMIGGEIYLPIRKIFESITDAKVNYNTSSKTLTVSGGGHSISVSDGAYVLYASDRALFSLTPSVVLSDGNMYVSAPSLAKALGMRLGYNGNVSLDGTPTPLMHANKFYRDDEVYWLSRIINAESRGESLLGQIAVGGVVLNRVRSSLYPNTIWGVIFDKKYGVQFSPIIDGSIYQTPGYTSTLAAKICLEGFSISNEALFFLYPGASTSSWIPRTREYAFTVGKHDFYK